MTQTTAPQIPATVTVTRRLNAASAPHARYSRTVHLLTSKSERGFWADTACGQSFATMDGNVHVADTFFRDVTCGRCLRTKAAR
jgi:hypothetical protein